jgi:hypothetical protein
MNLKAAARAPTGVEPGPCRVRADLAAETTRQSPRRNLGSRNEAEQWTKAHERKRTREMETGNGRFEIDVQSGSLLCAVDAIQDLQIEKL